MMLWNSAFGGEDVGVRLEEAPVRLVEQEQQRIREARQAFREIAIGARGPFPDLRTFVEREHRLGMQVRGVVVVDVVEQIVMADVLADIADPVADVIGAEQAAVNRRRQPDQAPLARRPGRRRGWPHQAHEQRIFEEPLVALLARLAMNCKAGVHLGDHGCEVIRRIAAGFEAVEVTARIAHHRFRPVREGAGRNLAVEGAFRVEQERAVGERVAPARRWRAGVAIDDGQELRVRDQLEIVLLGHMPFDHLHGVFASELRQIEQEARLLGMEWRQRRAGEDDVEVLFAMRGGLGKRRRQRMQQHVRRAEQSRGALAELEMLLRAIADRGIVERVIVDVAILEGIGVVAPDHLRNGDLVEILGQQPLRAQ